SSHIGMPTPRDCRRPRRAFARHSKARRNLRPKHPTWERLMAEAATETVSRVRVIGRSEGLEKVKEDLRGIAKAGDEVAVSTQRQERAQVSAGRALSTWERQLDRSSREMERMARLERDLGRAREQGL